MTAKIDGTNGLLQNYDYQVLTTAFSYTFAAGTQILVINPAGTLATGTITMPASPADGMTITFSSTKQITALTLSGNTGQTVVSAVTFLPANQATTYVYRLSNTSWYPVTSVAGVISKVLQVVSTTKTDTFSTASTTFVDLTGLSVSITPTSTSSKILVFVDTNYSPSGASVLAVFNLVRDSTNISQPATSPTYVGTATAYINAADNGMPLGFNFLDSPATTSSTTYKVQVRANIATSFAVNRRTPSVDTASTSTITVMEIAA